MSSFDKVVKLACKPKPAPPKAKYLDPIIAATWSEDGAIYDVCKALIPRLREPNAVVVFKALIVLHTMIRNGATDNVLSHLSSSEVLRLRNVSAGNWEGYHAPQNLQHYALYLDSRIRAYGELKHDAIRVQAESNRDLRLNNSIEEDMAYTTLPPPKVSSKSKTPQRSKTIMGRKLRSMTVEKGLLRETKTVQKMINSLVECRFYLDDLEDELTITALRMLVKDLLILFQAGNEGVINVLEHYFEMSKYDAEDALSIYRNFCDQTERVVEYLGVAKKLQNLLNVPIPNLKHAPVSLASSLQEYLNDPNFEQNRIEYAASKSAGNARNRSGAPPAQVPAGSPSTSTNLAATESSVEPAPPPYSAASKPDANRATADLLDSIEEEQTPVFNPAAGSPMGNQLQQTTAHNPFIQRQMTGAFPPQPFGGQVQMQPTGIPPFPLQFAQPFQPFQPTQPFSPSFTVESQQVPQHRPFSTFTPQQSANLQSGQTAGLLQPQPTGVNPFRQSVFVPQATGMTTGIPPMPPLPAPQTGPLFHLASNPQLQSPGQPIAQPTQAQQPMDVPARPASTPLASVVANPTSISPPIAQPVKSHQTGSRNPFGVPVTPVPPVPKPPTLLELSMGFGRLGVEANQSTPQPQLTSNQQVQSTSTTTTESVFSTVASSFALTNKSEEKSTLLGSDLNRLGPYPPNLRVTPTNTSSNTSDSRLASLSSQSTNSTVSSLAPSNLVTGPIKAHPTGFGGVKPFKPTSNFGASLLESLPPMPQSNATPPEPSTQTAIHSSSPSLPTNLTLNGSHHAPSVGSDSNMFGSTNFQPTSVPLPSQRLNGGSTIGVGLRPQATGALGTANPFRATMFAATSAPPPVNGVPPSVFAPSASTPPFGALINGTGVSPAFGPGFGNGPFGASFTQFGQDGSSAQQQSAGASLI